MYIDTLFDIYDNTNKMYKSKESTNKIHKHREKQTV